MGIAIGDVNADGRPDVFTTNFADDTNTLRVSLPGTAAAWEDRTRQYNLGAVSRPFLGWATGFFDFDHDGDEDLLVFNGHVYPTATIETMDSTYRQTPLLFERAGARFERVLPDRAGPWLAEAHVDRSAAFGDLDGDGDVDVVVGERGGPVRVLENDGARGHWLSVALADRRAGVGNRHGLGSRVVLRQGDDHADALDRERRQLPVRLGAGRALRPRGRRPGLARGHLERRDRAEGRRRRARPRGHGRAEVARGYFT